jgi:hypothetical protein
LKIINYEINFTARDVYVVLFKYCEMFKCIVFIYWISSKKESKPCSSDNESHVNFFILVKELIFLFNDKKYKIINKK